MELRNKQTNTQIHCHPIAFKEGLFLEISKGGTKNYQISNVLSNINQQKLLRLLNLRHILYQNSRIFY